MKKLLVIVVLGLLVYLAQVYETQSCKDLVKDLKQRLSNFNQNMSDNSEVKVNDRNYVFDLVCEQNKNVQNLKPFINHLYKTLEKGGVYV